MSTVLAMGRASAAGDRAAAETVVRKWSFVPTLPSPTQRSMKRWRNGAWS